jgi:hypothetical protein
MIVILYLEIILKIVHGKIDNENNFKCINEINSYYLQIFIYNLFISSNKIVFLLQFL